MQRVRVDGAELPYTDRGAGQPLLLIHGGGPDMHTLEVMGGELATDHRVISYNRRGYWEAGPPATSWRQHGEDAATILEDLGASGAIVVSFSAGGIVALDLAVHRPDLVAGLVLHEPAIYGRSHITPSLVRTFVGLQIRRRLMPPERATVPFFRWVMSHRDGTDVWNRPDYTADRQLLSLRNSVAVLADMDNGDGSHIARERLGELQGPVTLVLGERSQTWFHRIAATLQTLLPAVQVVEVPGVGHAMTFEDPAASADAIREGIRNVRGIGPRPDAE
jgi:pimeloyl-ACP methyl ester carboxylesterase